MRGWLSRELVRLRVAERELVLRVHHGLLVGILIGLAVGLALGFLGGYSYPYKTVPPPPVPPGQTVPDCNAQHRHTLGSCLPRPVKPTTPAVPASTTQRVELEYIVSIDRSSTGPDLSNNDPVFGDAAWAAIGARNSFAIFKVNESTGYIDPTAAGMAAYAKRHGLVVGGYDFLHVCGPNPIDEADTFIAHLRADGLTGQNTLPGTGDAEFGDGSVDNVNCNARAWLGAWVNHVRAATGRQPMIYTGAWWWNPHMGCFWPNPSLAWVSGYTGSINSVPRPCGRGHIDLWQFSDAGFNGVFNADFSVWVDGAGAFALNSNGKPPDPYVLYSTVVFSLAAGEHASEHGTVSTWDGKGCENQVRRPVCKSTLWHLKLLRDRDFWVARHRLVNGQWRQTPAHWSENQLGLRVQGIQHRITAPTGQRCTVAKCG